MFGLVKLMLEGIFSLFFLVVLLVGLILLSHKNVNYFHSILFWVLAIKEQRFIYVNGSLINFLKNFDQNEIHWDFQKRTILFRQCFCSLGKIRLFTTDTLLVIKFPLKKCKMILFTQLNHLNLQQIQFLETILFCAATARNRMKTANLCFSL